jgi:hypothetical protein
MTDTTQYAKDFNKDESPLATRPRRVALLGLGPSIKDFFGETARKNNLVEFDEVWGINTAYRAMTCDRIWIMDNLTKIEQNYPDWARELKLVKTPIITSLPHDDFPTACPYPLSEVTGYFKDDYFSNTVAYAVAYAAYIGVEELYMFGIDFHYPNSVIVESGLGCVGYWLGIAKSKGVHYKIPGSSTLLDANLIKVREDAKSGAMVERLLYGYDYNPQDSKRKVDMEIGNENDAAIAERSYRPADNSPETLKQLGLTANPKLEPK